MNHELSHNKGDVFIQVVNGITYRKGEVQIVVEYVKRNLQEVPLLQPRTSI